MFLNEGEAIWLPAQEAAERLLTIKIAGVMLFAIVVLGGMWLIIRWKYSEDRRRTEAENAKERIRVTENIGSAMTEVLKQDSEFSLYYLQSRYYDSETGRFISPDSLQFLDSSDVQGLNLYTYCNNNPVMDTDPTGYSILLTLGIIALALFSPVGGAAAQLLMSTLCYVGIAVASLFDEEIRNDMNNIKWNPFNSSVEAVINSKKVSYYNGVPVFRVNWERPGTFCAIFYPVKDKLDKDDTPENILNHEYGHIFQQLFMGPGGYSINVVIPSACMFGGYRGLFYYQSPVETMADIFGGVNTGIHVHSKEKERLAKKQFIVSLLCGPIPLSYIYYW